MNGRDLLRAIADAGDDYARESEQSDAIAAGFRAERKRKRQRSVAVGIVAVLCVAVFVIVRRTPQKLLSSAPLDTTVQTPEVTDQSHEDITTRPVSGDAAGEDVIPTTAEEGSSASGKSTEAPTSALADKTRPAPAGEPDRSPAGTEPPTAKEPSTANAPDDGRAAEPPGFEEEPDLPPEDDQLLPPVTAAESGQPSAEGSTETADNSSVPGTPGAVYTSVSVSYGEAKESFGYPIVACSDDGFTGYQVGVVSLNGDIRSEEAICLSVTYGFTHGSIGLLDQDRMTGSVAGYTGERYEYGGRTFYVQTHDESYLDYSVEIGYFPSGDSGVAYQAFFDETADVYQIMDLIISLEL